MDDESARYGRRSGSSGGIQPHSGRTRGHTCTRASNFTRVAHLAQETAAAGREAGSGGDGGRDDAQVIGRRAEAAGALRCPEHRSRHHSDGSKWDGAGRGPSSSCTGI